VHSGEANLLSAAERVNHWRIIDHCLTVILETPSTDRTILDVKAPVDWCFTMFDVPPFLMIRAPCQSCFMDKFEPTIVTFHFFIHGKSKHVFISFQQFPPSGRSKTRKYCGTSKLRCSIAQFLGGTIILSWDESLVQFIWKADKILIHIYIWHIGPDKLSLILLR
jgi:hypothetical protein